MMKIRWFSKCFFYVLLSFPLLAQIRDGNISKQVVQHSLAAAERGRLYKSLQRVIVDRGALSDVRILISIPLTGDEQLKMFGRISQIDLQNNRRLVSSLNTFEHADFRLLKRAGDLELELEVAKKSRKNLVIIGHNVDGLLHFGDGSNYRLTTLNNLLQKLEKRIAVLSCNASEYVSYFPATSVRLTFRDAVYLAKKISARTSAQHLVDDGILNTNGFAKIVKIRKYTSPNGLGSTTKSLVRANSAKGVNYVNRMGRESSSRIFEQNAKQEIEEFIMKSRIKWASLIVVGGAVGIYYKEEFSNLIVYGNTRGDEDNRAIVTSDDN